TALDDLALVYYYLNKLPEAEELERRALAMRRKLLGPQHRHVAISLNNLASIFSAQQRTKEAEEVFAELRILYQRLLQQNPPDAGVLLKDQAGVLINWANALSSEDKLPEAEAMLREAQAAYRKSGQSDLPSLAASLNSLAAVLRDEGKLSEAKAAAREGLAI